MRYEARELLGLFGFAGVTTYFEKSYKKAFNPPIYTMFFVLQPTIVDGTYRSPMTSRNESPGVVTGFSFYVSNTNNYSLFQGNGLSSGSGGWGVQSSSIAVQMGEAKIITLKYDGSDITYYDKGSLKDKVTHGYETNKVRPLRVGAGSTEVDPIQYFYGGYIGEIIIFDRNLKNKEQESIEKYLVQKWGT